jgi:hypothetical protein
MGETDSYYDWERSKTLDTGGLTQNLPEKTQIGISRKELKAFLKQWKKQNDTK